MMGKQIGLLFGSPRKGGNTDLLAQAFTRGAQRAGHSVTVWNATHETILGCKACDACWSRGKPCVFDDGFNGLAPILEASQVIVLASPLYWFGISAQLKAVIDKFYAYSKEDSPVNLRDKSSILLMAGGTDLIGDYDGALSMYRLMADYLSWQSLGEILALNVYAKGDIMKTDYLQHADALGASL